MRIDFDLDNIILTEFGIGRDDKNGQIFSIIAVDKKVQIALREMTQATWTDMQNLSEEPSIYEPSEKYSSAEYVYIPLEENLSQSLRLLHTSINLPSDQIALRNPSKIFCYFVRLTDNQNRRLTAIRRSTQFKGVVKSRLVRIVSDTLKMIEDKVFKLDLIFDLLIDAENIHILHPSGFEFIGGLKDAVLNAASENIDVIKQDLNFVDFSTIEVYAGKHPRAARYLASIRAQGEMRNIDSAKLKNLCKKTGVELKVEEGIISIDKKQIMGFLEVLDRRRYQIELIEGEPESYRAPSRSRLN